MATGGVMDADGGGLVGLAERWRECFYTSHLGPLGQVAAMTESPLEAAMFWGLLLVGRDVAANGNETTAGLPGAVQEHAPAVHVATTDRLLWIAPQLDVRTGEHTYRLDLAVLAATRDVNPRRTAAVDLELDGHDFHERTPEQAERDRRRDRDLQAIGWRVARFTGSHVLRDPVAARQELFDFIDRLLAPAERKAG